MARGMVRCGRVVATIAATSIVWVVTDWVEQRAISAPADVFRPHLEQIQQQLPPGMAIRLPGKILLGGPADDDFINKLIVKVSRGLSPLRITVELLSCENDLERCWVGSFSVVSSVSVSAQRDYQRHRYAATPIRLSPQVRAYVLDNLPKYPSIQASSVMWEQDGLFYSAQFASPERQNMLYMALSMVNSEPIYALQPILRDLPIRSVK